MRNARTLLVVAVALLVASAALAQEKPKKKDRPAALSPTARAIMRIERLQKALEELDLTAEQKESLKRVREKLGPTMHEIFEKINKVLTEEQKSAGEAAMNEARESGKKEREVFEAVEAALKLTDQQKEKMDKIAPEIVSLQRQAMKEITAILTPEQKEKLQEKMAPPRKKEPDQGGKKKAQ